MIWRTERTRRAGGFTLLEMLIVLVILALLAGIVAARGPMRSHGLDVRALRESITEALRAARARAIAGDRTVLVAVNGAQRRITVQGGPVIEVPAGMRLAAAAGPAGELGEQLAAIRFAPDGSASGGRIELADGSHRIRFGVDWLTGRVSVRDAE